VAEPTRRARRADALRVLARPEALDALALPDDAVALRLADDDLLLLDPPADLPCPADPDAIVERDTGFAVLRLDAADAARVLERHAGWPVPATRPALALGPVAGIPARVLLREDDALVVVHAALAADLEERLA
jgi:hypothetical protein